MSDKTTLNRFPLFGLFAYRAALRMGHSDSAGRLLGYSTAVLYAIFKAKGQKKRRNVCLSSRENSAEWLFAGRCRAVPSRISPA